MKRVQRVGAFLLALVMMLASCGLSALATEERTVWEEATPMPTVETDGDAPQEAVPSAEEDDEQQETVLPSAEASDAPQETVPPAEEGDASQEPETPVETLPASDASDEPTETDDKPDSPEKTPASEEGNVEFVAYVAITGPEDEEIVDADTELTITWEATEGIESFLLAVQDLQSDDGAPVHREFVSGGSYTLKAGELECGTDYRIWIGAEDQTGALIAEDEIQIHTLEKKQLENPADEPEADETPQDELARASVRGTQLVTYASDAFGFTNIKDGEVIEPLKTLKVNWTAVSGASYYLFSARNFTTDGSEDTNPPFISRARTTDTYYSIPGANLTENTIFRFWVGAFGADDTQMGGAIVEVSTGSAAAETLEFTNVESGQTLAANQAFTVYWSSVSSADHYEFSARNLTTGTPLTERSATNSTSYTLSAEELAANSAYRFWVGALDASGELIDADQVEVVTAAGVPTVMVTDVDIEPHKVTIYGEILSNGGAEIAEYGYFISRSKKNPEYFEYTPTGSGTTTKFQCTIDRKDCFERIYCGLYAQNSIGYGTAFIAVWTPCCHEEDPVVREYIEDGTCREIDSDVYHLVENQTEVWEKRCDNLGNGSSDEAGEWKRDYVWTGFDTFGYCGEILERRTKAKPKGTFYREHSYMDDLQSDLEGSSYEDLVGNEYVCEDCGHEYDLTCPHTKTIDVPTGWMHDEYTYVDVYATAHKVNAVYSKVETVCQNCYATLNVREERGQTSFMEPHGYEGGEVCKGCGHVFNCDHSDDMRTFEAIDGFAADLYPVCFPVDERTHRYEGAYRIQNHNCILGRCTRCGELLLKDRNTGEIYSIDELGFNDYCDGYYDFEIGAHTFEDGRCTECGYSVIAFRSPKDGASVAGDQALALQWSSVAGANYYEYSARWLDQEKAFLSHQRTNSNGATIPVTQMLGDKSLQLWVGAYDADGKLLCADTIQVTTTEVEPLSIAFTAPEDGASIPIDESLYVEWTQVDMADHYEFSARYSDEEKAFIQRRSVKGLSTTVDVTMLKPEKTLILWIGACDERGNVLQEQKVQSRIEVTTASVPKPLVVDFRMQNDAIRQGKTAVFDVYTQNAEKIQLIVDGVKYETYVVTGDPQRVERVFEQAGERMVQFRAYGKGLWSEPCEAQKLTVSELGRMPAPQVSNIAPNEILLDADRTVYWSIGEDEDEVGLDYYQFELQRRTGEGWESVSRENVGHNTGRNLRDLLNRVGEYRLIVTAVAQGTAASAETTVEFAYRTIPAFSLTAIENDERIGTPVTVRWEAPVWTADERQRPDRYVVWWYGPGLNGGLAQDLPGDATSATLAGENGAGDYSVNVYALLGEGESEWQRIADGNGEFSKAAPEVRITYPNAQNHIYLTTDSIDVVGQALGGVRAVKVTLEKDGAEIVPLSGGEQYRVVAVAADGTFEATLSPAQPMQEDGVYAVAVYGYYAQEDLLRGDGYVCNHWQTLEVNGSKADSITLNNISGSVWIFAGQSVVVRAKGNTAMNDIAVTASNGANAGLDRIETPVLYRRTLVSQALSFSREGRYALSIDIDGKSYAAPGAVYAITRMDNATWYVFSEDAQMTSLPGTGRRQATPQRNQTVEVIGSYGDYYCVNFEGRTGFMLKSSLSAEKFEDDSGRITSPKNGDVCPFFVDGSITISFTGTWGAKAYKLAFYEGTQTVFSRTYSDSELSAAANGDLSVTVMLGEIQYFSEEALREDHQITIEVTAITD